jgi:hypothetical protein
MVLPRSRLSHTTNSFEPQREKSNTRKGPGNPCDITCSNSIFLGSQTHSIDAAAESPVATIWRSSETAIAEMIDL